MKYHISILLLATSSFFLYSCKGSKEKADGYGNFEATEVMISSEANGKLLQLNVNEGENIEQGKLTALIDTIPIYLKKKQLLTSKEEALNRSSGILSQINVIEEQIKTLKKDRQRIENLLKENAATQKQLDDVNGQLNVFQEQIKSITLQNAPVLTQLKSVDVQIAQLNDQIKKSMVLNPFTGTVLSKYAEANEITAFGKPLYKIADLSNMILRVYVSEKQLPSLKIGQTVQVKFDEGKTLATMPGKISWISSEAEFTPKIIQTKEERVNLVYALKVSVKNDGRLKIGMPGEMWIQ